MKKLIVVAIAAITVSAVAQTTSTTAPIAPATETAAQPATAPVAKKKKTVKKTAVPTAVAPATSSMVPAVAPTSSVAPAVENPTTSTAPAATSTTAAPATEEGKKWSVALVLQASATNEAMKQLGSSEVSTINYVGAGYKLNKTDKVGIRQYFSYATTPNKANRVEQEPTVLTFGTKMAGIFGSDEIAPSVWYYIPNNGLTRAYNTDETISHNGILRLDAEIAWTLNPKWTVSYYLNPRQSMVAKQSFVDRDGKTQSIEADSRLIHYGYVYYNVSDAIQPYSYVGMDHRARTETFTSHSDSALLGIGASFVMAGGKFVLNPEIANTVGLKSKGVTVAAPRWLQSDDLEYVLTAAMSY
ncbi:MAG: hypothetical protein A2622_12110 [Bdellovibrionales bacterium RIFCSPHIGHO2_01_FULL_40_29]|nr:MAG: hypothetical protein A2622_12110 [Bdellovibrionales bacterium RIFCSPHIGHO2_01_FULL_40_29]OFZ32935.1 MAG: hypothetical protein A3D17_09415 [Bdellovibrionales bacterium RIFCSPHIGHO2_02_FULL_40_15]